MGEKVGFQKMELRGNIEILTLVLSFDIEKILQSYWLETCEIVHLPNGQTIWGVQFLSKDEHTTRFRQLTRFVVPICLRKARRNRMHDCPSFSVSRCKFTLYPMAFRWRTLAWDERGASGIWSGVHASAAIFFFGKTLESLERYPLLWPRLGRVN